MHESKLQSAIIKLIRKRGGYAVRVRADAGGNANEPDIVACYNCRALALEVKMPGKLARKAQLAKLAQWQAAGAFAKVVYSADQVEGILDALDDAGEL